MVRERRAVEVDAGLQTHLERGGGALFLTLTLQHHRRDTLASRLDVIASSIHDVLKGSAWDRRREALGYVGTIKAVEVTWGEANGWHPHSHSALLFDRPITDDERADLLAWITQRWTNLAESKGLGTISQQHGVDLKPITDGDGIGHYVTKVEGGWTAGHELARGDRKSNAPVQLLRNLVATGEKRWALLWQEYEHATYGKRSLRWSPGLRAHLLGVEDDQADEQLAASEGADLTLLRALIESDDWNRVVKAGATGALLDEVERGAAFLLGLWSLLGGNPQPLDVPGVDSTQRGVGRSPTDADLLPASTRTRPTSTQHLEEATPSPFTDDPPQVSQPLGTVRSASQRASHDQRGSGSRGATRPAMAGELDIGTG